MQKGSRAFETLAVSDQKALIDVALAMAVIVLRLPEIRAVIAPALVEAFADHSKVTTNHANYAMQDVWQGIQEQDWEFIVSKKGVRLATQFIPTRSDGGGNGGENGSAVQEPKTGDRP